MLGKLLYLILSLTIFVSCFENSSDQESGGGLFYNNQEVEDRYELRVPLDGVYQTGNHLDFVLVHPIDINVAGTPRLTLTIGSQTRYAQYIAGSGSRNLIFRYTIVSADSDLDGIDITPTIDLNGGTLEFSVNGQIQSTTTSIETVPSSSGITVDSSGPEITLVTPPLPRTYYLNESLAFSIVYDDVTYTTGVPQLELDIDGNTVYANYQTGSGTNTHIYIYQVQAADLDNINGIEMSSPLSLNGGSITDESGNDADLTFTPIPTPTTFVNGVAPLVESFNFPTDGTYFKGSLLSLEMVFNKSVIVAGGTPGINIDIDGSTVEATYLSGSGTDTLVFNYIVQQTDIDENGITYNNAINLNGSTIQDSGGEDANLSIGPPLTPGIIVDGSIPEISAITLPADKTYITGEDLDFVVTFTKEVDIENFPKLNLQLDSGVAEAQYLAGTGTKNIIFRFSPTISDGDNDGIAFQSNSIDLNTTGTIKDSVSNLNASLDFSSLTPFNLGAVLVNVATPTQLVITTGPTDAYKDIQISPSVRVEIRDASNNLVTSATDTITVALANDPSAGAATLGGTTSVMAVGGVAIFPDLELDNVQNGYTLNFTSGALTAAISTPFNISLVPATQVAFVTQPSNTTAGTNIAPAITVEIRDVNNNIVTSATDNVTLALSTDPSSGTAALAGTLTVAAVSGVATFNNINLDKAFTGYILEATSGVLSSDNSSSFDISPGVKSQLSITTQPSVTEYNSNITPSITVDILDAYGNKTADTDSITLAINNNPGGSTLGGTTTQAAVNGTATFSDISLDQTGSGYTLDATSGALTLDTSNSFDVTATPTQLIITQEPTDTNNGFNITPALTVELRDATNNLVTNATDNVTVAFSADSSTGSATLSGTTTVNAVGGIATFSDLNIDKVNNGYSLNFTSGSLTNSVSSTFNITQAPATQLVFVSQPTNSIAGENISPTITVEIRDAQNNLVTNASDNVTLALSTDPSSGAAALGGTLTVAAVSGVATFNDITLDKAFTGYTLQATSGGLNPITSNAFNITPAVKNRLAFKVQPVSTEQNTNISPSIEVEIQDVYGNRTTDIDTITIAISNNPASGTLSGTLSNNAVNGVASFTDLSINNIGSGYRLNASASGITSVASSVFDISGDAVLSFFQTSAYDFGTVNLGDSQDATFLITHLGDPATSVTEISLSPPFNFTGGAYPGTGGTCGTTITGDCTIGVSYTPTAAATSNGSVTIQYFNGSTVSINRNLTGTGFNVAPTMLTVIGPNSAITNNCIPYTITSTTSTGANGLVTSNENVTLVINNGSGNFYSDSSCSSSISNTTIANGTSSKTIYFQTTIPNQNLTLIFNGASLANTSRSITSSNEPVDIIANIASEVVSGECVQAEVSLVDASGVKTGASSAQLIDISTSGNEKVYNDAFCTGEITQINYPQYEGIKYVYIKNNTNETSNITFSDNASILSTEIANIDFVVSLTWWDLNYSKRIKISLNNLDQNVNFNDLPVLIKLDSSKVSYGDLLINGDDIRFTLNDHSTTISHSIDTWNTSGESFIWIKVPTLNASSETDIYMYYSYNGAVNTENRTDIWSEFEGVWLMNKAGANYVDETGSGKDGVSTGSLTDSTGPIGATTFYDGSSSLDVGYDLSNIIGRTSTLSFMVKTTQIGNNTNWQAPGITGVEEAGGGNDIFFGFLRADGSLGVNSGNSGLAASNFVINDNTWRNVTVSRDETSGEVRFYVNGVYNSNGTSETGHKSNFFSEFGVIADTGGTPNYFTGELDNIRLSNTILSDDRVKAEYKFTTDTHISYGQIETP